MALIRNANVWGTAGSGVDQQRSDLFRVSINLPQILNTAGQSSAGVNVWDDEISWAVTKCPLPDRIIETIPVKFMQQTNMDVGADAAMQPFDMEVRYAFGRRAAVILERWFQMISNQRTGMVALSSTVKTNGFFYWLVPNVDALGNFNAAENTAYRMLRAYELHGVWLAGCSPTGGDHTAQNEKVTLKLKVSVDRYFPVDPNDLSVGGIQPLLQGTV